MQQIIRGIEQLSKLFDRLHCLKIMLVSDASYPFLSIKEQINSLNIPKMVFNEFTPNPLQEQVERGSELFLSSGCDAMLAVGGGSAIDVAKCIKLVCINKVGRIPFVAIPTTAGTGSESTHNAVVYLNGVKQTVTDDRILPDVALLEPSVLDTLPIYQKKCTMMDALCQGIESWWSVNSTDESKTYSKMAVGLIMRHWKSYIFDNDKEAAWQIMLGANYSGRAINLAQTTAAHAMSYKITSIYGLPHGHAVAVCLPEIWQYMLEHLNQSLAPRQSQYLLKIFEDIANSMGNDTPEKAIQYFREIMDQLELTNPVANNKDTDITILTQSVNPIRLKNNPIPLESEVLHSLYQIIIK